MSWLRRQKEPEHRYFEEQLSAYLDGELLPREREAAERHLAECPSCRWNLKTLRQTVQWTSELPMVRVPRSFAIPVPARPAPAARRWRSVPVLQGATALVALLLFFVVAGDVMLSGFGPVAMPRPEPQALAPQATSPPIAEGDETAGIGVVETVVLETEAEGPMMQEAPAAEATAVQELAAEEPAAEESAKMFEAAPAEVVTVTQVVEMRITLAPAAAEEAVGDAREEGAVVAGGAEPSLALEVPAESPIATATTMAAPTLEPAPTAVAAAPPSAQVEAGEALAVPSPQAASESRYSLSPAVRRGMRWVEYGLGVLLIVLVGSTIGAMVLRRNRR